MITDASGSPSLIGAGDQGRVGPLVYFPGKPGAWSGETITPDFAYAFDAAFAADGTLHALWASDKSTWVGHRTTPATWSSMQLDNAFEGDLAITVGKDNQPRYVFFKRRADMSARDVFYVAGSAAPVAFSKQPFGTYGNERTQIALATGDVPIVVLDAADGTHLLGPSMMPVVDVAVPEMKLVWPQSCHQGNPNQACPGTCNESADGSSGHALRAAGDGTVWLASLHRHVDRDYNLEKQCGGTCVCNATLASDRSTAELTLAKASATGTVDVRWRLPLANADGIALAMAIQGTRAHVALVVPGGNNLDAQVRYLAVDLSKL